MRSPRLEVVAGELARENRLRGRSPKRAPCDASPSRPAASSAPKAEERGARLAAEHELDTLKERFEQTQDEATRGELAISALEQVDVQLRLAGERRRELDREEGRLWARRNRIERFLIRANGGDWWRARREAAGGRS